MEYNISTLWIKHLKNKKEKEEFKGSVIRSDFLLERIRVFCKQRVDESKPNKVSYKTGSWAYEMADHIGYERAMNEVMNFCTIKEVDNTDGD